MKQGWHGKALLETGTLPEPVLKGCVAENPRPEKFLNHAVISMFFSPWRCDSLGLFFFCSPSGKCWSLSSASKVCPTQSQRTSTGPLLPDDVDGTSSSVSQVHPPRSLRTSLTSPSNWGPFHCFSETAPVLSLKRLWYHWEPWLLLSSTGQWWKERLQRSKRHTQLKITWRTLIDQKILLYVTVTLISNNYALLPAKH